MQLKDIDKWIRDLFPQDLQDALEGKINEPTSKGRKSSIDDDNVNDIAYYLNNKKTFGNSNQYEKTIKGTNSTPLFYAISNSKYKCISYIAIKGERFALKNPFSEGQDPPMWYKLLYIVRYSEIKMENKNISIDSLYDLFMQCPKPVKCAKIITTEVSKNLIRKKMNKQKDQSFYQNLSIKDKRSICKLISKKQIDLDIDEIVLNDGDASCIVSIFGFYKFTEYCVKTKNIDCFKAFIDSNASLFDDFANCHIILPQFKEYYIYAFLNAEFYGKSYFKSKNKKYISEHVNKLIKYGFYNELKFMELKGYIFDDDQKENILSTRNKNIIDVLDKDTIGSFMGNLDNDLFMQLVKMGYRPNMCSVCYLYTKPLKPYTRNFEVLEMVDKEDSFDSLKGILVNYHPELIKDFIAKYESRCKEKTIESWDLISCDSSANFLKSCEILNVDPKNIIDKLFDHAFFSYDQFRDKKKKDIIFMCIDYGVDVTKTKYLKVAIKKNDVKMAAKLVRAGCTPSHIHDWKSECSNEMYRTIMDNL